MDIEYKWYELGIMAAVISFLGFLLENIWLAVTKGYIDNRNMHMPFLLGYGILVIGIYLLLGTPDDMVVLGKYVISLKSMKLLYCAACVLIVSAGELLLGILMEKLCGIEYWNYSWIPMHITKYTSVPTSIGFGIIITLFMDECFPYIMNMITPVSVTAAKALALILMVIMGADFAASFGKMFKRRELNIRWQKKLVGQNRKQFKRI